MHRYFNPMKAEGLKEVQVLEEEKRALFEREAREKTTYFGTHSKIDYRLSEAKKKWYKSLVKNGVSPTDAKHQVWPQRRN